MLKFKTMTAVGLIAAGAYCAPAFAQAQDTPPVEAPQNPELQSPTFQANIQEKAKGSPTAPADPYPIEDAGWGNPSGKFFASRWVEDWTKLKAQGKAPPLKAMPLFGHDDINLTLSGEIRLRDHSYDDGLLKKGNDYHEFTFRAVMGADLHITDHFRVYAELGHGDTAGMGNPTVNSISSAYENDLSVNQIFGEARTFIGSQVLVGVQGGRFEFADGPRQLISLSNGPNLHRTWNGARFYLHTDRFRFGAFTGHPTLEGFGTFDEHVDHSAKLSAITASVAVIRHRKNVNMFFDPLYYHSFNAKGVAGPTTGIDHRDTYGARLWGKDGPLSFDFMGYRQTGDHIGRDVKAWMSSLAANVLLSPKGVRPRIGFRVDMASGGGAYNKTGTINTFNVVYQSTSYLGEGHLLGDTNLLLLAPTVAFTPIKDVTVNAEYDLARRMTQNDAFYSSGGKAYSGTQNVAGYNAATFGRLIVDWKVNQNVALEVEGDHLGALKVLNRAGFHNGNYLLLSLDLRY